MHDLLCLVSDVDCVSDQEVVVIFKTISVLVVSVVQ